MRADDRNVEGLLMARLALDVQPVTAEQLELKRRQLSHLGRRHLGTDLSGALRVLGRGGGIDHLLHLRLVHLLHHSRKASTTLVLTRVEKAF